MMTDVEVFEEAVASGLAKCASRVEHVATARWRLSFDNGQVLPATARIDDAWLVIDAAVPQRGRKTRRSPKRLWDLLRLNAQIASQARFVVRPSDRSVHLRAEMPLDEEGGASAERARLAGEGCKAAFKRFVGNGRCHTALADDASRAAEAGGAGCDLVALCGDTGWDCAERASGSVSVGLDVPSGAYRALVAARQEDVVSLSVDVADCESMKARSRNALGLMLLTASGIVRMVRAAAGASGDRQMARLEVIAGPAPTATELVHALSALSVACRLCGAEARALQGDEEVARRYLSSRGCSS